MSSVSPGGPLLVVVEDGGSVRFASFRVPIGRSYDLESMHSSDPILRLAPCRKSLA